MRALPPLTRWRQFCWAGLWCALLVVQANAQESWDLYEFHWLELGTWGGSVEANVGLAGDTSTTNGNSTRVTQRNSTYLLNLQNAGFSVINPALLTGTFGVTLGTSRDASVAQGISSASSTGSTGYSLQVELLNDAPYGGGLIANKAQTSTLQPFGRQEVHTRYRGASLRLNEGSPLKDMGLPYLSANLRLDQQDLDQASFNALSQTYQFAESRRSLTHDGHKGWVSADLNWRFDVHDVHLPINPDGDNRSKSAAIDYSMDFGERLNWHWDSHLNAQDRTGVNEQFNLSTRSISGSLQVSHFSNLSSSYSAQRSEVLTQGRSSALQGASAAVQYQPYRGLSSSASLQRQKSENNVSDSGSLGLGYQYQHDLPWGGQLALNVSGGYGLTRSTNTSGNTLGIIDFELHPFVFDPLAPNQEVVLGQRFVDTTVAPAVYAVSATLNVVQATLLACPGNVIPFDGTCDYVVEPLGNQTRVRINPQSTTLTGLGNAVDSLAVTYLYNIPPTQTYDSVSSSTSLTLNYNWISFSFAHSQSRMSLRSEGDSRFLGSSRLDRAQVDLHGGWRKLQGAAALAYQVSNDGAYSTHQSSLNASASYPFSPILTTNFSANLINVKYQNPARASGALSLQGTLNWQPDYDLSVSASAAHRRSKDSQQEGETTSDANLKVQLRYGKIRLSSLFGLSSRVRGDSKLNNWRLNFNMMRDL